MWIVSLVVIGILVYFLTQDFHAKHAGGSTREAPLEILKKRYARGEITKDEFERMRQSL